MKVAFLQITSSDQPADNLLVVKEMVCQAAQQGAQLVCTPEVTNCVSLDRDHQNRVLSEEKDDVFLVAMCELASELSIWLSIGSLALKGGADGRFVNRSFLIAPGGEIRARYDKIHMFDVDVSAEETYRESSGYAPGKRAVLANMGKVRVGLTICYDLRFPQLYRDLAKSGAEILLVPAAFSPVTGRAHWEPLLRARAIETGCFVIASAQTGTHAAQSGRPRQTYGHACIVSPWGEVLAHAGTDCGITSVELDLSEVSKARARVPSLRHDRDYDGP